MGGQVFIRETEAPGAGHFAWFGDPHGNTIGLWKPLKRPRGATESRIAVVVARGGFQRHP